MWSYWNRLYLDASYPRLIVRFEDTLFHAEQIMDVITTCAGINRTKTFHYNLNKAKQVKVTADFATALRKYGSKAGRFSKLNDCDKDYLQTHLDDELLKTFQYTNVPKPNVSCANRVRRNKTLKGTEANADSLPVVDNDISSSDILSSLERLSRLTECRGKERILEIVLKSTTNGEKYVRSSKLCEKLPTWDEFTEQYGDEPIIYGLDSCDRYRYAISAEANNGVALEPAPKVAGMFNTGTKILAKILNQNFKAFDDFRGYSIPGGDSVPAHRKWQLHWKEGDYLSDTIVSRLQFLLPIVIVRDPFRWFQAMVRDS
jgi:hypothetical protein